MAFLWAAFTLPQILGYIALMLEIYSFLHKSDRRFLFLQMLVALAWALHYGFLAAWTGLAISCLTALRYGIARYVILSPKMTLTFVITIIALGYMSILPFIKIPADILPAISATIICIATFYTKGLRLRLAYIAICPIWLAYNIAHGSIGGICTDILMFSTNIFTIARMIREKSVILN